MNAVRAALCFTLAWSCSSDSLKGNETVVPPAEVLEAPRYSSEPMGPAELCPLYESYWQFGSLCTALHVQSALDFPADKLAVMCAPGREGYVWAEDLLESLGAGRITIDWTRAHQCVDDSRKLRADHTGLELLFANVAAASAWKAVQDGPCKTFFKPATGLNQPCKDAWDCQEGLLCGSIDPHAVDGAKCLKPAADGEPCTAYLGCGPDSVCSSSSICVGLGDGGDACNPAEFGYDCRSQECDESNHCAPVEVKKPLGAACYAPEECDGACVTCRAPSVGAVAICMTVGAEGDYCAVPTDCVGDKGCIHNLCTNVELGEACTAPADCGGGDVYCVPPINCWQYDSDQNNCEAQGGLCRYDAELGYCDPVGGTCETLPQSGRCTLDLYCAPGFYCSSLTTCVPLRGEGQGCTESDPCKDGLVCSGAFCQRACNGNFDCNAGEYCDGWTQTCAQMVDVGCQYTEQCGYEAFCRVAAIDCYALGSQSACGADPKCAYYDADCYQAASCYASEDETSCAATAGCAWDVALEWCDYDFAIDCNAADGDAAACAAAPGCQVAPPYCYERALGCSGASSEAQCLGLERCAWDAAGGTCTSGQNQCDGLLTVGAVCDPNYGGNDCRGGDCSADPSGAYRCAVTTSRGCYRDAETVYSVFLFGLVWLIRRRR
jgi:hypothetical protein